MANVLQRLVARSLGLLTREDLAAIAEAIDGRSDTVLNPSGYTLISGDGTAVDPVTIKTIQTNAQAQWITDPLIKQAVGVKRHFVLGAGITFTAEDAEVDEALHEFWRDPIEKMPEQLEDWFNSLMVTSELCLRLFPAVNGQLRVRQIPFNEITDVITDPDDRNRLLYIRRQYVRREFRTESKQWVTTPQDDLIPGEEIIWVAINRAQGSARGISTLYAAIPWAKAYSEWLQDRVRLNKAKGAWAWIRKVTGGVAAVAAATTKLASDIAGKVRSAAASEEPTKAPPKAGSVITTNGNVDWSVINAKVNADDAKEDGRALKLQVASAVNVFEHYFGDASVANLASAKAMELPMLREYETLQGLMGRIIGQVFHRLLEAKVKAQRLPDTYTITREILRDGALVEETIEKPTLDCPVDINWSPLKTDDRLDRTKAAQIEHLMEIKSKATLASELGVEDWQQERAQIYREREEREARRREEASDEYPPFPVPGTKPKKDGTPVADDGDDDESGE